jgi:predicted PurR-regulated permease PerM
MNTLTKALLTLVAVVVIAGGAYVMLGDSNLSSTMVSKINSMTDGTQTGVPPATDSIDDFAAAMQADVSQTASAISAFDTGVSASVKSINAVNDTSTLYDPANIK